MDILFEIIFELLIEMLLFSRKVPKVVKYFVLTLVGGIYLFILIGLMKLLPKLEGFSFIFLLACVVVLIFILFITIKNVNIRYLTYNGIYSSEDLLDFMVNNIRYGYIDNQNKVYYESDMDKFNDKYVSMTYLDVLHYGVGTCIDQVELERHYFKKYNPKTYFIGLANNSDNYPVHTFLTYFDNGKYYLFENADYDNRGIKSFESINELLKYEANIYYKALKNKYKSINIKDVKIFEYKKIKKGTNFNEFISIINKSEEVNIDLN